MSLPIIEQAGWINRQRADQYDLRPQLASHPSVHRKRVNWYSTELGAVAAIA